MQENCRFIVDIGDRIQPVWDNYCQYQKTKGDLRAIKGDVELIVGDSEIRFAVGQSVWVSGKTIDEAVDHILQLCRS